MNDMMSTRRPIPSFVFRTAAAVATLAFLSGCGLDSASSADVHLSQNKSLALIGSVMKRVERNYVTPVDNQKLVDNALKGMVSGLDPHSDYLDRAEFKRMESNMRGKFGGLGMEITQQDGTPKVLAPIDGTPAARAGIDPGDLIVGIDGKPTDGMNLEDVVARLRGKVGTKVTLAIERADRAPFDVTLTRAIIHVHSVKSKLEGDKIGYARIAEFTSNTQPELAKAIKTLKREAGGHLNGFILDLRDDPGGELNAAVDVASDFLDGGTIVTTRGRRSSDEHTYSAPMDGNRLKGVPMVVLIDGASASASEIVGAALQDNHRAVLMGTRSFGKGSVQNIMPLDTGGALVLTTALYFTPSGQSIQGLGLKPNIVVPLPKDEQVPNRMPREADFFNAFRDVRSLNQTPNHVPTPSPVPAQAPQPAFTHPIKPTLIATAKDTQLKAAIDYLETKHLKIIHQQASARKGKVPAQHKL